MNKWPHDISKQDVLRILNKLGFKTIREKKHIFMVRINNDGTKTPLTMPNHPKIKGSILQQMFVLMFS